MYEHLIWKEKPFTKEEVEAIRKIAEENNLALTFSSEDELVFEYLDAYTMEELRISKRENQYGVAEYDIFITTANTEDEIHLPEALAQHDYTPEIKEVRNYLEEHGVNVVELIRKATVEYGGVKEYYVGSLEDFINEVLLTKYSEVLEEEANKEYNNWNNKRYLEVSWGFNKIQVGTTVVVRQCYLNIPHEHWYKGYYIYLSTQNIEDLKTLLNIEDLIINMYRGFLGA